MSRSYKLRVIISLIILISFYVLSSYKLVDSFNLTSDFGRDLYNIIRISQGEAILIGPKMNLGGYYSGPYYYYLFAPILFLTRFDQSSVLLFNCFLFALGAAVCFFISSQKLGVLKSLTLTASLSLLPLYLQSSHYPSNGYTFLPLLWLFLTLIFFSWFESPKKLFLLGLLAGIIINIHPTNLFILVGVAFYILTSLRRKKFIVIFLAGVILTFIPVVLFEFRHDFIMTRNTFINHSYLSMSATRHVSFWENLLFLKYKLIQLIIFDPSYYLIVILLAVLFHQKFSKPFFLICLTGLVASVIILRFNFEIHYIFALAFFLSFSTLLLITNSRFWFLTSLFILSELTLIKLPSYPNPERKISNPEVSVRFLVQDGLVDKSQKFNLIAITDAYALVPTGYEYRFFFRKYGYLPNSEYDYSSAKTLFIFSEAPYYDIDRFKMWATEEFGRKYFRDRTVYRVGGTTIYKITKT